VRVLLWHGWVLEGSGSNVFTARVAESLRHAGHDVVLLCQEPHPERFGFVDGSGTVGPDRVASAMAHGPGRCILLRPEIGPVLPVFVVDEYEGFQVKPFVELTDEELEAYLGANVEALHAAVGWHGSERVIAGHAVPGAVVARGALGPGRYVAKMHGSDLEYAVRVDPRYARLVRPALEEAVAVIGPSNDVLARAAEFAPGLAGTSRLVVIPPGVEAERFHPRPRRAALERLAEMLDAEPERVRGRPASLDQEVAAAIDHHRRPLDLRRLAVSYDESAPDPDAPGRLRALAVHVGPVVGYLGKLIPQKGVELFLQAAVLDHRDLRVLVVGFGSFREPLAATVIALDRGDPSALRWLSEEAGTEDELTDDEVRAARGFAERVTFTGRLDHRYAPFAVAAMDVLVVPSTLPEAFAMVSAEGAASGALPLVARHSGLAEVAEALEAEVGRPGLFSYRPGEGAAHRIADGIRALLSLPHTEREAIRRAISEFVAREWTWDRTAERLLRAGGSPPAVRPADST
jgi:glycosyltransferase involved in cell wall biosynthesis